MITLCCLGLTEIIYFLGCSYIYSWCLSHFIFLGTFHRYCPLGLVWFQVVALAWPLQLLASLPAYVSKHSLFTCLLACLPFRIPSLSDNVSTWILLCSFLSFLPTVIYLWPLGKASSLYLACFCNSVVQLQPACKQFLSFLA